MDKLYVNEIRPDGNVGTVGLFYSRAEAENIVAQLLKVPGRDGSRYEIIEAVRHVLLQNDTQRTQVEPKEHP